MEEKITYRDAGVDIQKGNEAVDRIRAILRGTERTVPGGEEVGGIGGFAGAFRPFLSGYDDPLLVASTDGVGTKLLLALEHKKLGGVGQDLVAMSVNDLIVCGAVPLFFLDYIATAKLDPDEIEIIVDSINRACVESGCLLIGGETAEMPGMYAPGHTDLAGFAVGIVDRSKVIDGSAVQPGDIIIGLGSSGIHSNGFTLVRKLIEKGEWKLDETPDGFEKNLIDTIIEPTKLYVRPLVKLIDTIGGKLKACSHITGGGLLENIPRTIPDGLDVKLVKGSWDKPAIFDLIQKTANLPDDEMYRTFNCGIGFVLITDADTAYKAEEILGEAGESVFRIGETVPSGTGSPHILID